MRLGIGTYTYMWSIGVPDDRPATPMTALDLIAAARTLGVGVVQFGPNLPLGPADLEAIATCGLEIEMGTKGLEPDHLARQVELAARAGARLLRTVPDYDRLCSPPGDAEIVSSLRPLLHTLDRHNVVLAIENATIPAVTLSHALDSLASPLVGITLDTVNSLAICEGTEHVARTLARHTLCLHLKDFAVDRVWHMMGFTVEGRPAGRGQLDIPWLLDLIRTEGRSPNAILELWPPRRKTLEETIALEQQWANESIEYLRRLIPD
jgi:sugar phosphate isomerase/epimerase